MNPFDYVKSINDKTENLMDRDSNLERGYNAFIVNRSFSNFSDTVIAANIMNSMHHLDNKLQYDYLYYTLKKRKRFSKWLKPERDEDIEQMISKYFKVNRLRAREYLSMMTDADKEEFLIKTNTGGLKK